MPTKTPTKLEGTLVGLEREYWDAMISKDPTVATRLTAERQIYTGPQGVSTIGADAIGSMVQSDGWKLKSYDFSDVTVLAPTRNMAIVAYHVTEKIDVDGESVTLDANDSTVWLRQNGAWAAVLHSESLEGDPFGRDRHNGHNGHTEPARLDT